MIPQNNFYFTINDISSYHIDENPETDFGYDYDEYDSCLVTSDNPNNLNIRYWEFISIELLTKILEESKLKGANYISIDYHDDHLEYDIETFNVRKSTDEEIEKYTIKIDLLSKSDSESKIAWHKYMIEKLESGL